MIVGSLFSGAGLLDAGLHQAGIRHAWFVERDEFRRGLLAQRWPGRPVHDDVRTVGAHNLERVDGIVGGFPCKGASTAGKRTGLAHPETALWAEFARIVGELEPRWVVVENVANILSLHGGAVWGTVLGDLAALGLDVAWDCVPAAAVGAPHGRDRVFAVARHAEGTGGQGAWAEREALGRAGGAGDGAAADAPHVGSERGWRARARWPGPADGDQDARGVAVEWGDYEPAIRRWEAIHGPAPEPLIFRLDDGDPKLRRMRARVDRSRLSALGDGVHVYVGRLIGDALMTLAEADRGREMAA